MTHIKRVDEMNMPTKFNSVRHKQAVKLASELMNAYEDGDLATAGDRWMKIYDLYEGETDIDATRELFDVMRIFPDNVVYDVTDYLKKR